MAEPGFFERWGQRKAAARQGLPMPEPEQPRPLHPEPLETGSPAAAVTAAAPATGQTSTGTHEGSAPAPALTVEDANALTQSSDFKPFMAHQVTPGVRNAAMKKLFADPHFNVMDGLDIYIDDYSKPDPIPHAMLRQMVSAQFLNLFSDEKAPSEISPTDVPLSAVKPEHDHTHLQLQPDHAASAEDSGKRIA